MPMGKRLGKGVQILLLSLLGLSLAAILWQAAARILFHQDPPYLFGYAPLTVLSGSMEPAFFAGDMVVIHREAAYAPGEIIAFQDEGAFITHRITEDSPEGFITKGDANNAPDPRPVPSGQIAGKVVFVFPGVGKIFLFLRTPGGMASILLLGGFLLFLPEGQRKTQGQKKGGAS